MRVAVGSDHRGLDVKKEVMERIRQLGHVPEDLGAFDYESVDYPDFAAAVGRAVSEGRFDRGILVCGTGIGMSIAANKVKGIRAAACRDEETAQLSRRHNDANVLCLPESFPDRDLLDRILEIWITTPFEGGRHARRVAKIAELERRCGGVA